MKLSGIEPAYFWCSERRVIRPSPQYIKVSITIYFTLSVLFQISVVVLFIIFVCIATFMSKCFVMPRIDMLFYALYYLAVTII